MTTLPPLPDHRMEALRALDSLGAVDEASGVTVAAIGDRAGMDAGRAWLAVSQLYHQGFVRPGSLFDHDDHRKYALTDRGRAVLESAPAQSGEGRSGAGEDAVAAAARQALGEWLTWPDAGRDGPREVTDDQVKSWLSGLPNKLASLTNSAALNARQSGEGEDWISHDGGDCPVDPAATVEIKLRDGSVTTMAAKAVNWRYGTYIFEAHRTMPAFCEVVAYRIAALRATDDAGEA